MSDTNQGEKHMIVIEREKLAQVLKALEDLGMKYYEITGEVLYKETFTAIQEASAQPAREPTDGQICDAQRIALIEYGDARESKDPERVSKAFVRALYTQPEAQPPLPAQENIRVINGVIHTLEWTPQVMRPAHASTTDIELTDQPERTTDSPT